MITPSEKAQILNGIALANANANDKDELITRPFRMSGYVPVNIPILIGLVAAPPTMKWTVFVHLFNQSYMAGLNYGNKNSSSTYTYTDLVQGYAGAVGSSVSIALLLRLLTANVSKGAKGPKLLFLNTLVNGTAGACAGFCNTYIMRRAEW